MSGDRDAVRFERPYRAADGVARGRRESTNACVRGDARAGRRTGDRLPSPPTNGPYRHPKADEAGLARKLDVGVQVASRMLGEQARQPQPRRDDGGTSLDPRRAHPCAIAAGEPHDERTARRRHRFEVRHAGVAEVRQEQAPGQGRRFGQKLPFRVAVSSDLDGLHLVCKPTVGGVDFHRGGLDGGEPTRKHLTR